MDDSTVQRVVVAGIIGAVLFTGLGILATVLVGLSNGWIIGLLIGAGLGGLIGWITD